MIYIMVMAFSEAGRATSNLAFPDRVEIYKPVSTLIEPLIYAGVNHTELYKRDGIAGAVSHFGIPVSRPKVIEEIAEKFNLDQTAIAKMKVADLGFTHVYRNPPGLTQEQSIEQELGLVRDTVLKVLEKNEWKPEQVAGVFVGSGTPPINGDDLRYADYAEVVAEMTGIPSGIRQNVYAACNSGGWAMADALQHPDLQNQKVIVVAVDNLTRQMPAVVDPRFTDEVSPQVFSNALAVMAFRPGMDLKMLPNTRSHGILPDTFQGLAALTSYDSLLAPVTGAENVYQVQGHTHMVALPKPTNRKYPDRLVNMTPIGTVKLFLLRNSTRAYMNQSYRQYQQSYPDRQPDLVVAHHANRLINDRLAQLFFEDTGIMLEVPWVMHDGNSSAATTLAAFMRSLNDEKFVPGNHVMVVSFGAGASFDVFMVEVGPINILRSIPLKIRH